MRKIILIILIFTIFCGQVTAWWDSDWTRYQEINITGTISGAQTDYQLLLNVTWRSKMQTDFDDLRFCNETHKIDGWLEKKVDGSYALIWIEAPTTPANDVNQTYYMYYGNSTVSNDWNITNTFIFGDDFEAGNLDKWNKPDGTPAIIVNPDGAGNVLELYDVGAKDEVNSITTLSKPFILDYSVRIHNLGDAGILGFSTLPWSAGNYQILDPGWPVSGYWGYKNVGAAWANTGHAFSIDTWYDMSHIRNTSSYTVYEGSTKIVDSATDTNLQTLILFVTGTGDQLWIDNVRIRKFAIAPPTTSFEDIHVPPYVNISLYSSYPPTLYVNYTGPLFSSYIVESNHLLNLSSLAFLMGINHTLTSDYHSYLKVPPNDIASGGIYRAHNRNRTIPMLWESNDTITEGNVWKWGGGTIDHTWIQNNTINSTHTWINVTGLSSDVLPSMFYLDRKAFYESDHTEVKINKGQGVIFKIWDLEQYRGRSYDYYINMYFDTQKQATPDSNIEIWYCNDSFNPAVDDPCLVCDYKDSWNHTRWTNHQYYQPNPNTSFAEPLQIHAGTATCPSSPTYVNYIYLKSDTVSPKSYILNTTNDACDDCNLSFAQTETMWLRDEVAGTNTPYAYTPIYFNTFTRNYLEFVHHLYVANDQDVWGHSDYNTASIGLSNILPTHCRFNYFWWDNETNYYMNATYDESFWINLTYGFDPDNGAALTHVLSLYDDNYNFVAFINSSLVGNQTDVDIYFDIAKYRSNINLYRLKIVSTDNEGTTTVTYSPCCFVLSEENKFKNTLNIFTSFPANALNVLNLFLSYLPLFIGIFISGIIALLCVGIFGKLKRW